MEHPILLILGFIHNLLLSIIVGGIIFKVSFQPKKYLIFGLVGGLTIYFVRSLFLITGLSIGLSTLVNLLLTIIIFKYVFENYTWKKSIISSTLFYLIMTVNEIMTLAPSLKLLNTNLDTVLSNKLIHFQIGLIQGLGLLTILLLVYLARKIFIDRRAVEIDN